MGYRRVISLTGDVSLRQPSRIPCGHDWALGLRITGPLFPFLFPVASAVANLSTEALAEEKAFSSHSRRCFGEGDLGGQVGEGRFARFPSGGTPTGNHLN